MQTKKRVLVTGADGQLGQSIKQAAAGFPEIEFFYTDKDSLNICKSEEVEQFIIGNQINFILNCAAYTAVDKAETEIELAYKLNRDAVGNLALLAQKHSAALIHISTDYVFDSDTQNTPISEDGKLKPASVYGKSKLEGEQQAARIRNHIIVRTSWLYSQFGHNFLKTMLRLGKEREKLTVVFDQTGTPTFAMNLAEALLKIIKSEKPELKHPGIYHYSNEGVCSWFDFAKEIMQAENINCSVEAVESSAYPTPAKRPAYSVLNKSKIKTVYQIQIPHWRQAMLRCLSLLKSEA